MVTTRHLLQCRDCRPQTPAIAGTIPASTRLRLRTRFCALCQMTQSRKGIPSLASPRQGVPVRSSSQAAVTGICRAINGKHVPRYLAEFACRLTRRHDLAAMIPRLTWASVRTPPMPCRLLKMAEGHA